MVGSWPPKKSQENSQSHGFNSSFNNSFNNHSSTNSFASPRKFGSQTNSSIGRNKPAAEKYFQNFDNAPRFQLFDKKAEIQYLDDDRTAAAAYSDRESIKEEQHKAARNPRTSGYDFDAMLKDVNVEDYHPFKK
jgi:hypothetical protein